MTSSGPQKFEWQKMGQFDNPKSIIMLFTGAFLVSLGVIAFLNVEIQSRSNYSTRIRNESFYEILEKKVSEMLSSLKEKNSHRRLLLYHLFVSENTTRTPLRKLQYFTEETDGVKETQEPNPMETHHRLRHEKKERRASELRRKGKTGSPFLSAESPKKTAGGSKALFNVTKNRAVEENGKNTSEVISKQKLAAHQLCYTTNDVLEIIAITCLVNFIFWFMIIFCVNIFTKNQMRKSQSCESLTSVCSVSEDELSGPGSKAPEALNGRNTVDCYVDSLNLHAKGDRSRLETEILVPRKSNETGKRKEKTFSIINWRRDKLIRFSNNFSDRNFVTDSEKNGRKKCILQSKKHKIVNSFSMENLIF